MEEKGESQQVIVYGIKTVLPIPRSYTLNNPIYLKEPFKSLLVGPSPLMYNGYFLQCHNLKRKEIKSDRE